MKNKVLADKICTNCIHYFVTGLFQSWGGTAGYCLLIQNDDKNAIYNEKGIKVANPKAIVQSEHTCIEFEKNVNR